MSYTVRSVEGNLKQKRVTCGLDVKVCDVGDGGTTRVGLSCLPEQDEKWVCRICNPPSGSGICKL